ncbi:5'-nucleotidase SurE (EC [Olavius algarvensis associated proteobacterium Delta 3]|nr:5'-nucleotidase SurE (EC [Olavius algarvensis associated proteobacterium Delta 3]
MDADPQRSEKPRLMHLLLTNDDGIYAEGLHALYRQCSTRHSVTVIAPDRERSAVGHGITLHQPLRAVPVHLNGGMPGYAVSGTPADCIKLAILEILKDRPDMVISGINPGANVGVNINYSGTVCAAKEAAIYGIPAIAVSMPGPDVAHYDEAARFILNLLGQVSQEGLPRGTFLNVNIPDLPLNAMSGVRISRHGTTLFPEYVDKRMDPRNRAYYWQGCDAYLGHPDPSVDETALSKNYISITPIKCDATDYDAIPNLKNWDFGTL